MRFILSLAWFPALLCAQSIAIPHSGIAFDEDSKTFRPVLGVPGAAMLGDALNLHGNLHNINTCSQQQFAVATAGREGVVTLIRLDNLQSSEVSASLITSPNRIVLSEGCSAAAIYSQPVNRLQIVTGLPSKPVLAADLTLDLPNSVSSLAVSDDGKSVIAAVPGKAIYLIPSAGRPVSLMPILEDAVVAMRGTEDAIVADRSANTVTLISNVGGAPASTVLARSDDGIKVPSGVWFDTRTAMVIVASSGNGKVNLLPVSGGTAEVIDCHCQLGGLSRLTDRTYHLQSSAVNEPLRILDLGAKPARVVFVASPERSPFQKGRRTASSENSKN